MTSLGSRIRPSLGTGQSGPGLLHGRRFAHRPRPPVPPFDLTEEQLRAALTRSDGWIRVGTIGWRSVVRYLTVWSAVMFAVLVIVLAGGYLILSLLGVTTSVSRALAIILDEPVPDSGVLPVLQPRRVLPAAMLASAMVSLLWLVTALASVLVHNAVSVLTGGVRVRLRTTPAPRRKKTAP